MQFLDVWAFLTVEKVTIRLQFCCNSCFYCNAMVKSSYWEKDMPHCVVGYDKPFDGKDDNMKRKLVALLSLALLTGCTAARVETNEEMQAVTTEEEQAVTAEEEQAAKTEMTEASSSPSEELPDSIQLSEDAEKIFAVNNKLIELTDEEWEELLIAFEELKSSERVYPKAVAEEYDLIDFTVGDESYTIMRTSGGSPYISVDGRAEYVAEGAFAELFERYCTDEEHTESTVVSAEDRLVGLSVQCDEPTNQQEYLDTARAIVSQWLDSLAQEEGRYHLESYTFVDDLGDNRVFHGDGYVNGGREFVCYVGFDTPTEDDSTAFFAAGTYDTFYHYYFGPGVLARFRWENGVCTLIDYDEAFAMLTSDRLKDGLFGISANEMQYKTFYDFMNDKENVAQWLEKALSSHLCRYRFSHNVMMLANGNVVFMDVGNSDAPSYNGEYVTTDMHQYFYDSEGDAKYSSPVDYIDGSGAVVMTYRVGFLLEFDDYNHDGNPDYAIRIDSDENGSKYDVRCMDINGTPWEDNDEIYIYGEFDESIRLQLADNGNILKAVDDGNGGITYKEERLFSDKSNTSHADVTDSEDISYRMYSQRFYLPEALRCYTAEDSEVLCYFWNNTAEPAVVGGAYEIQRKNGGEWETITLGMSPRTTVNGNSCAELCFDISGIASDEMAVYRIKTTANGKAVYGGFYYGTTAAASLDITAERFPSGTNTIRFEVSNTGMSEAFPEASLYRGGEKLCDISVDKLNSGEVRTVVITENDISGGFAAGEYILKMTSGGKEFACAAQVVEVPEERLYYFPERVGAKLINGDIVLSLTNNIWSEEPVTISYIGEMQVMKDDFDSTVYMSYDIYDVEAEFGRPVEVRLRDYSDLLREYEEYFEEMKKDEELAEAYGEEFDKIASMSFDEYVTEVLGIVTPEKGDLCRIAVRLDIPDAATEYVYFEMP